MARWTITECERCARDNTRCLLRAGEWVCGRCVPEQQPPQAGQLTIERDGADLGDPEYPAARRRWAQIGPDDEWPEDLF